MVIAGYKLKLGFVHFRAPPFELVHPKFKDALKA